jgi:hypothetical protein
MSYSYTRLGKKFLAQTKPSGSTAQGRMSYKGNILYSYNSKLAIIKDKHLLIDYDISHYSATTSKQTSKLLAINNLPIFYVNLSDLHKTTIESKHYNLANKFGQYDRARCNKAYYKAQLVALYQDLLNYHKFIKTDKRTKLYKRHLSIFQQMFDRKLFD